MTVPFTTEQLTASNLPAAGKRMGCADTMAAITAGRRALKDVDATEWRSRDLAATEEQQGQRSGGGGDDRAPQIGSPPVVGEPAARARDRIQPVAPADVLGMMARDVVLKGAGQHGKRLGTRRRLAGELIQPIIEYLQIVDVTQAALDTSQMLQQTRWRPESRILRHLYRIAKLLHRNPRAVDTVRKINTSRVLDTLQHLVGALGNTLLKCSAPCRGGGAVTPPARTVHAAEHGCKFRKLERLDCFDHFPTGVQLLP